MIKYIAALDAAMQIVDGVSPDFCLGFDGCKYVTREEKYDPATGELSYGDLVSVCLVAKIFEKLGMPLEIMQYETMLSMSRGAFEDHGWRLTDKAYLFLDSLQALQDNGETWHKSLEYARRIVDRRTWDRYNETIVLL